MMFLRAIILAPLAVHAFSNLNPRRRHIGCLRSSNDPESAFGGLEITNTLARLNREFKIQQNSRESRWRTLSVDTGSNDVAEAASKSVYLLEPPNRSLPSCVVLFWGGAGLGTYPQVAYNEMLLRISNRLNAAVITAPYNVGLDHFSLAKETGELMRQAVEDCQEDPQLQYPTSIPVYSLSHSLGAKLSAIYATATNADYAGLGMIAFNNFGFSSTIGMAKEFADQIRSQTGPGRAYEAMGSKMPSGDPFELVLQFAEAAVATVGIDFTPSQSQMESLIQMKYDQDLQSRTRLFTCDDDPLQNTQDFVNACQGSGPDVSSLPGQHLTPVYFSFGLDQIPSEELQDYARDFTEGVEKVSYGDEEQLEAMVTEVCDWILGKPPSQRPSWQGDIPLISAGTQSDDDR